MADWDFLINREQDTYGDNLLVTGDAEPGVTTGWDTSGVSTIIGGVGIYGDYAFKIEAGGYMIQDATPAFTPPDIEVYGFVYCSQYLTNPFIDAELFVLVEYSDDTFDEHTMPFRAALNDKYAGNVFIPAEYEMNWCLVREVLPINTDKEVSLITYSVYNNSDDTIYADNLSLRLNNNVPVSRGVTTEAPMIDKYGVNPTYLDYFKNMVYNSSFERFDDATPTLPAYWSGDGVVDNNSSFYGTYSCKLGPSEYIETASGYYINPSYYDNELTRVSFYRKLGQIKLQVYDVTNAAYFTLTDTDNNSGSSITFSATSNWQNSRASVQFDPAEHGSCTSCKVVLTNVHGSQDSYVDAVMVQPDYTGKWPQIYKDGPKSSAIELIVSATPPSDTTKLWLDIS